MGFAHRYLSDNDVPYETILGSTMGRWYFERGGTRVGPHTEEEMRALAQSGQLQAATLCWTETFGSQWKPFSQTELAMAAPAADGAVAEPPPLPTTHVSDVYAWIYAFIPLIGTICEQLLIVNSNVHHVPFLVAAVIYSVFYCFIAALDARSIEQSGNPAPPSVMWFLLAPAYLWARGRSTGDRWKVQFWVMIAAIAGSAAIASTPALRPYFWLDIAESLPSCESSFAESEVIKLYNTLPMAKAFSITGIHLSDGRETTSSDEKRSCEGTIDTSNDQQQSVSYDFTRRSDGLVYVQVRLQ